MAAAGRTQHLPPTVLTPPQRLQVPPALTQPHFHHSLPHYTPQANFQTLLHHLTAASNSTSRVSVSPALCLALQGRRESLPRDIFFLSQLRPRLQGRREAERRLRRCGNPRRPSPGDRPGMLQRCSGGRARGTREVGDVSIGMPPPYSPSLPKPQPGSL